MLSRQLLLTGSHISYMEIRSFRADLGSMRWGISCLLWTISLIVLKQMAFHTRGNCVPQHWSRERSSILEPCSNGHQRFLAHIPAFVVRWLWVLLSTCYFVALPKRVCAVGWHCFCMCLCWLIWLAGIAAGLTAGASGTWSYWSFCQPEELKGRELQGKQWKKK